MSTSIISAVTAEELLAMPDDSADRERIRGQLKEQLAIVWNRFHARAVARIPALLGQWQERFAPGQGQLHAGEVGCIRAVSVRAN